MLIVFALVGGILVGGLAVVALQRLKHRGRTVSVSQDAIVSLVLDSVDAAITVYSREGRLIRANRCAQRLSGFTEAELCNPETWQKIIPPEEYKGVAGFLDRPKLSDFPRPNINSWISKSGTT